MTRALLVLVLVALTGAAAGHAPPPAGVVAAIDGEASRRAWGVEGARRDAQTPRLLVIRVGPGWYARPIAARRAQAAEWLRVWRHAVERGVVAVVDGRTAAAVVRFGPGGQVLEVAEAPRPGE